MSRQSILPECCQKKLPCCKTGSRPSVELRVDSYSKIAAGILRPPNRISVDIPEPILDDVATQPKEPSALEEAAGPSVVAPPPIPVPTRIESQPQKPPEMIPQRTIASGPPVSRIGVTRKIPGQSSRNTCQAACSYPQPPQQTPRGYPTQPPQAPRGYAQPTRGYSQLQQPRGYSQVPQAPRSYAQAPSSYSQAPSGYSEAPRGYGQTLQVPRGYGQTLQAPRGYSAGPQRAATCRATSGPPGVGTQRTLLVGMSRPPMAAVSQTVTAEISKPHPKGGIATARVFSRTTFTGPSKKTTKETVVVQTTKQIGGKEIGKPKGIPQPKPSRLQRFDQTVSAELSRRKTGPTETTTTTSDTNLLEAVDKLAKAEAAHSFAGAVAAAEAAAAAAPNAAAAEEAAAEGARCYQAEIVDVVDEDVPGDKPVQVIGYVGITRPKYAAR